MTRHAFHWGSQWFIIKKNPDLDKTIEIFKFIFGYDKHFILNKIHFFNRPVNNKHNKQHQLE